MTSSETSSLDVVVRDEPDRHRYVIEVAGNVAGFVVYHVRAGRHLFVHTEIDPEYGGQGLGSKLARGALDDVETKGGRVVPICPFIAGWIDHHPEYRTLVDEELQQLLAPTEP